jgi:hypothetical protein
MPTRPSLPLVAALTLAALATVGACSNQGEGQLCDATSDDCQSPLQCVSLGVLGYRCCPASGAPTTTAICEQDHPGVADANVPPAEGGGPGGNEAGPDAPSQPDQGAAEAPPDAPAESSPGADASETGATAADASDGHAE